MNSTPSVVAHSKSLNSDETPSKSASHPNTNCLIINYLLQQIVKDYSYPKAEANKTLRMHNKLTKLHERFVWLISC